jgi:hypothetical protein
MVTETIALHCVGLNVEICMLRWSGLRKIIKSFREIMATYVCIDELIKCVSPCSHATGFNTLYVI